ncbi:peptidoglycan DD-metalloendopeptidase family protein [Peribacillus sp. NPDC097264]|uniref:peptidoglycan DD-metalloendopeptidase family protein n=1 Tax=Peribacillus sp. NPDC097264 TaxID=3390616 RepID=UPI003D0131E3
MDDRRKDIRNRIAKRRKVKDSPVLNSTWTEIEKENPYEFESFDGYSEKDHPLFKKEYFFLKILVSICLFLVVAVMFKHPSVRLDSARSFVTENMNQEFQFASVSSWYENAFGKPIAFLPTESTTETADSGEEYAMPASGEITQTFEANGEGIIMETSLGSKVEAINEGVVIFAGEKEGIGKTVVIQHANKSESWYGQLEKIDVKLYDLVREGKEVGQVTVSEDGSKGRFYLAIKENDAFIDPKKVISFD